MSESKLSDAAFNTIRSGSNIAFLGLVAYVSAHGIASLNQEDATNNMKKATKYLCDSQFNDQAKKAGITLSDDPKLPNIQELTLIADQSICLMNTLNPKTKVRSEIRYSVLPPAPAPAPAAP